MKIEINKAYLDEDRKTYYYVLRIIGKKVDFLHLRDNWIIFSNSPIDVFDSGLLNTKKDMRKTINKCDIDNKINIVASIFEMKQWK